MLRPRLDAPVTSNLADAAEPVRRETIRHTLFFFLAFSLALRSTFRAREWDMLETAKVSPRLALGFELTLPSPLVYNSLPLGRDRPGFGR
jgi:hypothetical protein